MAFALVAVMMVLLVPAAQAHSQLVSSTPADGASAAALPASAELVFNEEINPDFAQIVLVDGQGKTSNDAVPRVKGFAVTVPLPPSLGTGKIAVRYRVVSKDGHPISGEIGFTVASPAGSSGTTPSPSTASTTGATSQAATAPTTTPQPESTTHPAGHTATVPVGSSSNNLAVYVLTGLGAAILAGIGVLVWRWEKQRQANPPPER